MASPVLNLKEKKYLLALLLILLVIFLIPVLFFYSSRQKGETPPYQEEESIALFLKEEACQNLESEKLKAVCEELVNIPSIKQDSFPSEEECRNMKYTFSTEICLSLAKNKEMLKNVKAKEIPALACQEIKIGKIKTTCLDLLQALYEL